MPKIPTFESRSRPTAEVASIKSNIQLSPTATPAAALAKVASSMEDYYIKQRDNVEKLEAKKKYLELKGKSDLIIEKNKNNADEFGAISSYTEEFNSLKTQELSKVQNRRVKKKLEEYLALEEVEGISTIKKNSFDAFEKDSTSIYSTEQETLAGEYTLETDPVKKDLIIKKRKESAIEFNNMHQLGKAALDEELKKIDNDSILFDVNVLMSRKQYGAAKAILSDPKNLSKINNKQRQEKLIAIEKESAELNENNYYASNLLKGNNVLIGAKFTSTTEKKAIQHTERILFSSAEKQQKNPEETFAIVDGVMSQNGIVSPTYKDLMEAGYNTGSITTFDSAADIPTTLIQAVKAAETADKFGRLNVYTNKEQERFYKNIVLLKKVKGFDDYQAIKQAKEFEQNYDANLLKGSNKQRGKTFEDIEQKFSDSKSSNINELRGYAGQLYDMYIMLGIDDNKARKQVVEDIKKNVTEIDNHSYLKRDIVAFQAIDGIDNLPVYKKYIIKNNMDKDEDPDDYYLRHNGGGQFEIRRRVDLSTVYNKENKEMIFYAKDLLKLKEQQTEEFKKDILEQQIKTQELRIFEVEQETMMP